MDILSLLKPIDGKKNLLPIYAPSGMGKTSLMNTLVCHEIQANGYEIWRNIRFSALEQIPRDVGNVFTYLVAGTKFFHESSNGQHEKYRSRSLIDVIADWKAESKARQPDKHADGWVIIFDQFEEMFFEAGRWNARFQAAPR